MAVRDPLLRYNLTNKRPTRYGDSLELQWIKESDSTYTLLEWVFIHEGGNKGPVRYWQILDSNVSEAEYFKRKLKNEKEPDAD